MDIVVTIPKKMLPQVEEEERQVAELEKQGIRCRYFWKLGRRPKKTGIGDKCYFVWEGAIRAWHEIIGFAEDMTCETTGIFHPGLSVVLDSKINEIGPISTAGFRGFRYAKEGLG